MPISLHGGILKLTQDAWDRTDDGPLFLEGLEHMSKAFTTDAIQQVLTKAHIQTRQQGSDGLVERFQGHCLRISGSQALNRMGFNTTLMMLLGRWGHSPSCGTYRIDSPLQELIDVEADVDANEPTASLEPELKKLKTEQKLVRDEVSALQTQCIQLAATR